MLSYIEISNRAILNNYNAFRSLIPPATDILCTVKGNAYGHGLSEIVAILRDTVEYFGVNSIEELRLVKKQTQKPVVVLGYIMPDELEEALNLGAEITCYDEERLFILERLAQLKNEPAKIHIKIDAHLGRQGLLLETLEDFLEKLKKYPHVLPAGTHMHFANIEDTENLSHAKLQIETFQKAISMIQHAGYPNVKSHMSSTASMLVYSRKPYPFVRLGVGLYGMWPSESLRKKYEHGVHLTSALRWVTHIAQVKTLPKDFPIGYGLTYRTPSQKKIAVIPQGYSDGYDRKLSNSADVLISGTRCPVLGRIAMNMFVVDVNHLKNVTAGDEVVLLGKQGEEEITAEELAEKIGTINYEITTRISPLLKRVVEK